MLFSLWMQVIHEERGNGKMIMRLVILFLSFILQTHPFAYALSGAKSNQEMAIQGIIEPLMKQEKIPGMAIAVYDGAKGFVMSFGFADKGRKTPITPDTLFDIASMTKVFTSTALAIEVEKGKMALHDPVTKYLPGISKSFGAINHVTLLQLATHSSSFPRVATFHRQGTFTHQMILHFLQHWNPKHPPGQTYLYSNLGFGVLGYALENEQKTPYFEIIEKEILKPLEMTSTVIDIPSHLLHRFAQGYSKEGEPVLSDNSTRHLLPGSGSLRSTASDLLKFLEANLGLRGSFELKKAMQFAQQEYFKASDHLTLGLAWQRIYLQGMLIIDKNGGLPGFSSYIGMIPEKKIGVVVLTNRVKANSTKIGRTLLVRLAQENPL